MKTVFESRSNIYYIKLSQHDIAKLIVDGYLAYNPTRIGNTYVNKNDKVTDADGHFLQYHGPEAGTIPVQFVTIQLEREE